MCLDCAGAYGLHVSPSLGAVRVANKWRKATTYFRTVIFCRKIICEKNRAPKGLQKGKGISGKTPLGAPLDPKLIFDPKFWKSESIAAPKWSQGPKQNSKIISTGQETGTGSYLQNDTRSVKNTLKVALKVNSVKTPNLNIRIGDLARRTARSALN